MRSDDFWDVADAVCLLALVWRHGQLINTHTHRLVAVTGRAHSSSNTFKKCKITAGLSLNYGVCDEDG